MRTTLKRGLGHHLGSNGNGRAVLTPPQRLAIVHYEQPPPRRRLLRVLGKGLMWLALGAATVAGGIAGGAYLWGHHELAKTVGKTKGERQAAKHLKPIAGPSQPAVALVIGYDKRSHGVDASDVSRSDTIMLIRADPGPKGDSQLNNISLLSFPRDMYVPIHCPNRLVFMDKINAAYQTCGAVGTLETVQALTGVNANYVVTVDFRGFKRIVGDVGGVWIPVDRRYYIPPGTGVATIDLQPGYQKLGGSPALDYVRYRHGDSDLYRVVRQQIFMRALKDRVGQIGLTDLPRLIDAVASTVKITKAGGGALSLSTAMRYAAFATRLRPGHVFQVEFQNFAEIGGTTNLSYPESEVQQAVQSFQNPDLTAASRTAAAAGVVKKRRPAAPLPAETSLVVLNGTSIDRLAANTSYRLLLRGYKTRLPANGQKPNAPSARYWQTEVYWNPARKRAQAAAKSVASLFGNAVVQRLPRSLRGIAGRTMLVVVLGRNFDGTLPPFVPVKQPPPKQPPRVVSNPGLTRSLLQPLQHKVKFKIELPTVIDSSSSLAYDTPVREYYITTGSRSIFINFKSAQDIAGYWGIQETSWLGAPILKGTHYTRNLGGRRFDFYYSGVHLHMIVLRENHTGYWVMNTLRDTLTNETMVAIARGLHPLGR
ncbi:MAG: LCP family glycopolymer transferase [Gaiellaceae bacterium]